MNLNKQQELLSKYLQGTATPEESAWVEKWYDSFDSLQPASGEQFIDQATGEVMMSGILKKIRRGKVIQLWQQVGSAAAILLIVLIGSWYYYQLNSSEAPITYSYITAAPGQHIKVLLPDSSTLWLNEQTTVRYTKSSFGEKAREIWLEEGEAYFEVKPNKQLPFIVNSGPLKTRVLGTAFNIKKAASYDEVQVSVTHGRVAVSTAGRSLAHLTRGNQLTYNKNSGQSTTRPINPAYATAWQQGSVELQNASFQELSEAFYSLYNTRLKAGKKEIEEHTYTITLARSQSQVQAVAVIAAIHELSYTIENGTIELY